MHFYYPVPNTSQIREQVWEERYTEGWDLNVADQLRLVQRLGSWGKELADVPAERDPKGPPSTSVRGL